MILAKVILRNLLELLFFVMVGLTQTFLMCMRCNREQFTRIFFFTFLMWVLLWKGNDMLSHFLSKKIPWIHYPARRFFAGMLVTIGYTVVVVLFLLKAFDYFLDMTLGDRSLYILYGAVIVTFLISFFLHAREFLLFWRKASFEREKFEKESIAARYESLKNQVSPHF